MKYQNLEKSDLELLEDTEIFDNMNTQRKRNFSSVSNFTMSSESTIKNIKPSENPSDYGMKKYSDIEIADHTLMISGLPKNIPRKKLEKIIKNLFEEVMKNDHDAFIKFYGTCSLTFDKYDCILGCYAIRCKFIKLYNHLSIDNYQSAEVAFARYVRFCGARFKEVEQLDIECSFSDDSRILIV
jgi:hypothetical protein